MSGWSLGAPRQQNLGIPFHQVLVDRRHLRIFVRLCRPAFGTRKLMLITGSIIVQPRAMILIILSVIILAIVILSPMAALIARCPFAVAAHSFIISLKS